MLNTIFKTFYEYQAGEPIWMLTVKAFNCLLLFVGAERLFDFIIRKYNKYLIRKEEEELAKKVRPIGFR